MRRTFSYLLLGVLALMSLTLAACGSGTNSEINLAPAESATPVPEATEVPTSTPDPTPTPAPAATPGSEPQYIDLGNGVELIERGMPQDVTVEGRLDPDIGDRFPNSKNWDSLHSDIAVIQITQDGQPASVENDGLEICFPTKVTVSNKRPAPYYWDTSNDPLLDGRQQRVSSFETDPQLVVCMMARTSGAYGLVDLGF
jgi:hypothetical protein